MRKIKYIFAAILLISAIAGLYSCEKYQYTPPAVDPLAVWSLQTDIQPIFDANCVSCHAGTRAPDLRTGKSFQSLTNGGYVSLPAATSTLYETLTSGSHDSRTTETEKLKILYWVTQGAKNN